MKTRYIHDCLCCTYLGSVSYPAPHNTEEKEWTEEKYAELYCCTAGRYEPAIGRTIIARFSSKGSDYASSPHTLIAKGYHQNEQSTSGPALIAAYWFAVAKKLIEHKP